MQKLIIAACIGILVGGAAVFALQPKPQQFWMEMNWKGESFHLVDGGVGEIDFKDILKVSPSQNPLVLNPQAGEVMCFPNLDGTNIPSCISNSGCESLVVQFEGPQFSLWVRNTCIPTPAPG